VLLLRPASGHNLPTSVSCIAEIGSMPGTAILSLSYYHGQGLGQLQGFLFGPLHL
jgi:hypothetical protein